MSKRCSSYTGVSCVDGSCPIANRDEYIEYGIPVTWSCDQCHIYKGCEDCYWCDNDNKCKIGEKCNSND